MATLSCNVAKVEEPNTDQSEESGGNRKKPGLWTSEGRLFNEKTIYLDKTTTKYVIIGVDPVRFEAVVHFCCRLTGNHFTLDEENFHTFLAQLDQAVRLYEVDTLQDSGVKIKLSGNFCTLYKDKTIFLLHCISIDNLLYFAREIIMALTERSKLASTYRTITEKYQSLTAKMNHEETCEFLKSSIMPIHFGTDEYNILSDLICNYGYFVTLDKYKNHFYALQK